MHIITFAGLQIVPAQAEQLAKRERELHIKEVGYPLPSSHDVQWQLSKVPISGKWGV